MRGTLWSCPLYAIYTPATFCQTLLQLQKSTITEQKHKWALVVHMWGKQRRDILSLSKYTQNLTESLRQLNEQNVYMSRSVDFHNRAVQSVHLHGGDQWSESLRGRTARVPGASPFFHLYCFGFQNDFSTGNVHYISRLSHCATYSVSCTA